jgi:hypothetical protein
VALLVPDGVKIYEADLDNFVRAVRNQLVPSGCAITAQSSPNMTVQMSSGELFTGVARVAVSAAASIAIAASDPTNPRIDLIYLNVAGTVAAVTGTAAAIPKPPVLPANGVLLAYVSVAASAINIQSSNITDRRQTNSFRLVRGTLANRPTAAAATNGATYLVTDGASGVTLYTSDGSAWIQAGAGSTVVNNGAGTLASRPGAGTNGYLYLATDVDGGTFYRDDGASWVQTGAGVDLPRRHGMFW